MDENITIQNNMQEDLQVDSINSGSDDNGIYTVDDDATVVMSGDLLPGGTDADVDTLQPGDNAELSDITTSGSPLSVSSGDVVGTEHVYISLADLETYQADTVENQIDYSAPLGSIEEKIDDLNYNITALLFFIVFAWCYERIKNAVRSFNGVGLKQEEINMDSLIQFIIGDATTFTPACMVGLIVFCMVLECIGSLAYNILKNGR